MISCFNEIQIGLTFLVSAYPGCSGKQAVKWISLHNYVSILYYLQVIIPYLHDPEHTSFGDNLSHIYTITGTH